MRNTSPVLRHNLFPSIHQVLTALETHAPLPTAHLHFIQLTIKERQAER